MPSPTLIATLHGTASESGLATIHALVAEVGRQRGDVEVELCFLDVLTPDLPSALAKHPDGIIVPALLSTGYHVLKDIPDIITEFPGASVTPHLGPDRLLSVALAERLGDLADVGSIALVASGSSVDAARLDLDGAASDLAELTGRPVQAFTLNEDVRAGLAAMDAPAVSTYLLAEGFFYRRLQGLAEGLAAVSPVIGAHSDVAALMLRRYDLEVSARL